MSSHITSTVGLLKKGGSGESWTAEIDRVLRVALTECRPTYLTLPTDLVHTKVSSKGLQTPLPRSNSAPPAASTHTEKEPEKNKEVLDHVVQEIAKKFEKSEKPVIIVDICADRFGCGQGIRELVEKTGVRFFETPMGKSVVDEQHPNYGGTYVGANSLPAIRKEVEDSDFVIMCGRLESDFNSGSFTFDLPPQNTVELHSFETKIGYASYPGCDIRTILPSLTEALEAVVKKNGGFKTTQDKGLIKEGEKQREEAGNVPQPEGELIKHDWLWPRVGEFLQEHGKSQDKGAPSET
jgi:pyruvate decarboxylase